jgi:acylphosphatase
MVQGVGYRWFAHRRASQLGITGYVRNLPNGDVEVECEGDKSLIADYIEQLRIGPRSARVTGFAVTWEKYTGEFKDFRVLLT